MKRVLILLTGLITCINLYGQADTVFCNTYGAIQNDVCNQIEATNDGGYIMIGTTNSFGCGNTDFYAVKIDSLGRHEWSKVYGGTEDQGGYSVVQTFDKGYAFVGFTDSYGAGGYDVYLVKTDSMGNFQWQRTYGGSNWDFGYSIQQLPDSGFVICGLTYSYGSGNGNVYVIRTHSNGDTVWTRALGGANYNVGNSICVEKDSLYAIVGGTTNAALNDTSLYFILMDNKGIVEKDTTYFCTQGNIGNSIRETMDHGYIISGYSDSIPDSTESNTSGEMILKTDSIGNMQWMEIYHSTEKTAIAHDAIQYFDGSYLLISTNNAYGSGGYAMRTWHIASNGTPLCAPSQGGTLNQQGNSIAIGKNGNVIFAGASDSPDFTEGLYDIMLIRCHNDSLVNSYPFKVINFHDTSFCTLGIASQPVIYPEVKIFPNPLSTDANLLVQGDGYSRYSFNIYNEAGECVISGTPFQLASHGQSIAHFQKGNLAAGVYVYEIFKQNGIKVATGKFIVE